MLARHLLAIALLWGLAGCAGTKADQEESRPLPTLPGGDKVYAPTGPFRQLEPVVDPEFHMKAARRDYVAGLRTSSVQELEKLQAFLGYELDRASGDRRRALEESRDELHDLAQAVARNEVKSVADFDRAFAHARAALLR